MMYVAKPCVSVIVPVYNAEKWIRNCIDSILSQDLDDFELIIVDDGSRDNTYSIVSQYEHTDKRIKLYKVENNGAAAARNFAIEKAVGEYIYFCDADDWIEKDTLSKAYRAITEDKADLVVFGYYMEIVNSKGEVRSSVKYTPGKNTTFTFGEESKDIILELWDKSCMYNLVNRIFKKSIIKDNNIKFRDIVLGEDMEFCSEYISHCKNVATISDCLYHYIREREDSVTTSYRSDWFELREQENEQLIAYFKKNKLYSDNAEEFLNRRFLERVLGCIENEMSLSNKTAYKEKRNAVKNMIISPAVRQALKNVKPTSKKSRILMSVLNSKSTGLNCLMGSGMSFVRNNMSGLFFKLKSNR